MLRTLKLPLIAGAAAVLAATFAGSSSAAGPNLLTNPSFDGGVGGWTANATPSATISPFNGTAKVTNTSNLNTATHGIASQCVGGIAGGHDYGFTADSYIPSGQARDGSAGTRIFWYEGNACDGVLISSPQGATWNFGFDSWKSVGGTFEAPANAHSAKVMVIAAKKTPTAQQNANDPFEAHFDNAVFQDKDLVVIHPPLDDTGDKPQGQPTPQPEQPKQPDVPEIPYIPEVPVVVETPTPPVTPAPTKTPAPQTPAPETPGPKQPQQPATPAPQVETPAETPATPVDEPASDVVVPLPPSTGNAIAMGREVDTAAFAAAFAIVAGSMLVVAGLTIRARGR